MILSPLGKFQIQLMSTKMKQNIEGKKASFEEESIDTWNIYVDRSYLYRFYSTSNYSTQLTTM